MTKITERMLEDWICENPEKAIGHDAKIIGRQIPLLHGRLDVLAWSLNLVNVIELKVRPLKEKDIGQVARYAGDVMHIVAHMGVALRPDLKQKWYPTLQESIFRCIWYERHGNYPPEPIRPYLIGPAIDDNTLSAAFGVGVGVGLWQYDETTREFTIDLPNYNVLCANTPPFPQWALELNELIEALCKKETQAEFEGKIKNLFGVYGEYISLGDPPGGT